MRKELFSVGDYVHVYNRGNRKQPIIHQSSDGDYFVKALFYFNTKQTSHTPFREINKLRLNLSNLEWPENWPPREPIIKIIAFVLMPNHFHLILKEIRENGISKFMQRLGTGLTMYYNTKYQESGSLFQGSYKAKIVDEDLYLKYLSVYIQVKNIFELYPGGLEKAIKEFNKAYDWATDYMYGSLTDFVREGNRGIIEKDIFLELFSDPKEYKEFARECMLSMNLEEKLSDMTLED